MPPRNGGFENYQLLSRPKNPRGPMQLRRTTLATLSWIGLALGALACATQGSQPEPPIAVQFAT